MRINLRVNTGPDDVITFKGVLLVRLRDETKASDVYLRFAMRDGESADSLSLESKTETVTFQRSELFIRDSQGAGLRFLLYYPIICWAKTSRSLTSMRPIHPHGLF